MDKKEKEDRIIAFLSNFTGHFGSNKLNKFLNIPDNEKHSLTHAILETLEKKNIVEQYKGYGFRITKAELEKRNRR